MVQEEELQRAINALYSEGALRNHDYSSQPSASSCAKDLLYYWSPTPNASPPIEKSSQKVNHLMRPASASMRARLKGRRTPEASRFSPFKSPLKVASISLKIYMIIGSQTFLLLEEAARRGRGRGKSRTTNTKA